MREGEEGVGDRCKLEFHSREEGVGAGGRCKVPAVEFHSREEEGAGGRCKLAVDLHYKAELAGAHFKVAPAVDLDSRRVEEGEAGGLVAELLASSNSSRRPSSRTGGLSTKSALRSNRVGLVAEAQWGAALAGKDSSVHSNRDKHSSNNRLIRLL